MNLFSTECHDCNSHRMQRRIDTVPTWTLFFSSLPFVLTWLATVVVAQRRLFPILASDPDRKEGLPTFNKEVFKAATNYNWREHLRRPSTQKIAALVFSATIGLSAVLVELLLCEISNTLDPAVRGIALELTLESLLALILLVTPALEIHSIVTTLFGSASEAVATSSRRTGLKGRLLLEAALLWSWICVFWYIPQSSLLKRSLEGSHKRKPSQQFDFTEACLERIGIIGISLMGSLAGFAAVSSLWQTFGVRRRAVKEVDIARRAAGLSAAEEMLATKQSRLRALQRKMSESNSPSEQTGFVGKVLGSFRGSSDTQEVNALQLEISGLQTMQYSLSNSLNILEARHNEQERSSTKTGRLLWLFNVLFAIYCAYRVGATSLSSLRRWWHPSHSFAASDPINNFLAIMTTHWDGNIDQAAWSRQISFLLSGIMLLASFNAVLQTFRLFARFAPALIQHAQTSLPLIISQIAGTYVISSALLLRSNLPAEMSGVITEALGAPLESGFVENWFEGWFLTAVGLTTLGIVIGRKAGTGTTDDDLWDDDDSSMEFGKRN